MIESLTHASTNGEASPPTQFETDSKLLDAINLSSVKRIGVLPFYLVRAHQSDEITQERFISDFHRRVYGKDVPFSKNLPDGTLGNGRSGWKTETASEAFRTSPATFIALESWTGRVESIDEQNQTFEAILRSDGNADEIGEFKFNEISPDDKDLLLPGAVFYWTIGQSKDASGRVSNMSTIRFRRLRHWSRKILERSQREAAEYYSWL